jgi:AraC-like DNA-binding protein
MNADLVHVQPGVRARLEELGGNVAHAALAARVPASGEVDTERFFAFWESLGASSPPDIGLRLATRTQVHEYDVSSLAALHSPDLRTALDKLARYKRLCGPKDLSVEVDAREAAISTVWLRTSAPSPPRLVDASLASLLVLLQRGTGLPIAPKRVELTRSRADEAMLARFFDCPLRFRARRDALVLDARALDTPFVTHNADLLRALLPSLEQQVASARSTFVDEVRAVVRRRMSGERPSVGKVARELSLSPRTLQRRLGEHGETYQQVLDGVRHRTALELLRSRDVEIAEVAFLLGFEELNSFTRAFRAWEGTTPSRWRASNGAIR